MIDGLYSFLRFLFIRKLMMSLQTRKRILFFSLLTFLRAWRRQIAAGGFFCTGKNMKDGNEIGTYNHVKLATDLVCRKL